MIIQLHRIEVVSHREMEMIDITPEMDRFVEASGAVQGIVFVMTAHTTSGIVVTEGVSCLERDIPAHLERLAPKEPPEGTYGYYHNRYLDFDGRLGFNAADHLKSVLGGINTFFPIEDSKVVRGSRQRVYFVEYDGPLARTVFIQIIGQARLNKEMS
ncbi:MAG: secondary thiamine-phosphate synthase enzyme YjbQ [Acidobacteriaceae bacterium]